MNLYLLYLDVTYPGYNGLIQYLSILIAQITIYRHLFCIVFFCVFFVCKREKYSFVLCIILCVTGYSFPYTHILCAFAFFVFMFIKIIIIIFNPFFPFFFLIIYHYFFVILHFFCLFFIKTRFVVNKKFYIFKSFFKKANFKINFFKNHNIVYLPLIFVFCNFVFFNKFCKLL